VSVFFFNVTLARSSLAAWRWC